jgi:hypothetical protein
VYDIELHLAQHPHGILELLGSLAVYARLSRWLGRPPRRPIA